MAQPGDRARQTGTRRARSTTPDEERTIELTERIKAGDPQAFEELVRMYRSQVAGVAYKIVGDYDDAKDISQMVFVKLYHNLRRYDPSKRFSTWLYRIAFNSALTRRRRKRARVSLDQIRDDNGLEVSDTGDAVDEPMLRRERVGMVRDALQTRSDDHRSILVLRELLHGQT